jgi:rhodanese-related sulfurtransferase
MNWFYLIAGAAFAFFIFRLIFAMRPGTSVADIRAALVNGSAVLVDVREPAEWTQGIAEHALLLPLSDLRGARTRWMPALEKLRGKKLYLYCQSGARSGTAAAQLRKEGFDAANAGSYLRWQQGGGSVTTPGRNG